MTEMDMKFYQGLEKQDLFELSQIPKSDVHNHAGRGGKIEDLSMEIAPRTLPFDSLNEMQVWFEENVKTRVASGVEGFLYRVEASFKQAKRDSIKKLALSFSQGDIQALNGIENFSKVINSMKIKYIPESVFIPELTLLRSDISDYEIAKVKDVISYGYFKSIDICGNEKGTTLDNYVDLYKFAKLNKMLLKVHVGEFGTASDVVEAVDMLELDEVHHGIAAANSRESMKFLRDNNIILNICPMSNIMLKRADSYIKHPIRKLFNEGVAVTINTDDLSIFNATVSDEYLNLYKNKVFSYEELNQIRLNGLSSYNKY